MYRDLYAKNFQYHGPWYTSFTLEYSSGNIRTDRTYLASLFSISQL